MNRVEKLRQSQAASAPMTNPAAPTTVTAPAKEPKREKPRQESRLPHDSTYSKRYDGAAKQWTTVLSVPTTTGRKEFVIVGSGSMRTEFAADELYRAWLAEQNKPITDE